MKKLFVLWNSYIKPKPNPTSGMSLGHFDFVIVLSLFSIMLVANPFLFPIPTSAQQAGANVQADVTAGSSTKTTNAYAPNPININIGDTVTWTNQDTQPHTVTSGSGQPDGKFDSSPNFSPIMSPQATFSHAFQQAGNYPYYCGLHPNMVGTVIVAAGGSISITVATDKASYNNGENVIVTGTVTEPSGNITQPVLVRVIDPQGNTYRLDQVSADPDDGEFSYAFLIGGPLNNDGTYTVTATYKGISDQDTFELEPGTGPPPPNDITPPDGTALINSGAPYTNSRFVMLSISCEDQISDCSRIYVSTSNPDANQNPAAIDDFRVIVFFDIDQSGETLTARETAVNSGQFTLEIPLQSTPNQGTIGFSDGDIVYVKDYGLSSGDGVKLVEYTFEDTAGNIPNDFDVTTIILDTTLPFRPSITSPQDGSRLNDRIPTIQLTSEADTVLQLFFNGNERNGHISNMSAEEWSFEPSSPLADGSYTIIAIATDPAGNTSPASEAITFIVDTTAASGDVVIDSDAKYTNDRLADLSMRCDGSSVQTERCYEMRISTDGTFDTEAFEQFRSSKTTTLPAGDGVKTIAVQFRSQDQSVVHDASDSIILDMTAPAPPEILSIKDDDAIKSSFLDLEGDAEQGSMVTVYTDNTIAGKTQANSPWRLLVRNLAEGGHTISATATDEAGNVSPPTSVRIIRDNTSPVGSIVINFGRPYAYSDEVSLGLDCFDASSGCALVRISGDGAFDSEGTLPFSSTMPFKLPSIPSSSSSDSIMRAIFVEFIDRAGNVSPSPPAGDSIEVVRPSLQIDTLSSDPSPQVAGGFNAKGLERPTIMVDWGDGPESLAEVTTNTWKATHSYALGISGVQPVVAKLFDQDGNMIAQVAGELAVPFPTAVVTAIGVGVGAAVVGTTYVIKHNQHPDHYGGSTRGIKIRVGIERYPLEPEKPEDEIYAYDSPAVERGLTDKLREIAITEFQNEENMRRSLEQIREFSRSEKNNRVKKDEIVSKLSSEGIIRLFDRYINEYFGSQFIKGTSFNVEIIDKKSVRRGVGAPIATMGGTDGSTPATSRLTIKSQRYQVKFKPNFDTMSCDPYIEALVTVTGGEDIPICKLTFRINSEVQIGGVDIKVSADKKKKIILQDVVFTVKPYVQGLYFAPYSRASNVLITSPPLPSRIFEIKSIPLRVK